MTNRFQVLDLKATCETRLQMTEAWSAAARWHLSALGNMGSAAGTLSDADREIVIAEADRRRVRVNETMGALDQHRAKYGC
jgi:hypothetical protein